MEPVVTTVCTSIDLPFPNYVNIHMLGVKAGGVVFLKNKKLNVILMDTFAIKV